MPTFTVSASADDAHMPSIANDSGRAPTGSGAGNITSTLLSPGSHGSNDEWSVGARFTGVSVANGATISSASFSMKAQATYSSPGTISYLVSGHASDNSTAFTVSGGLLNTTNRPRTTAVSAAWDKTVTVSGTRYSIDVTSVVQELVNRAGWASGNAMSMLVDTNTTTTLGEWTDFYAWDDTTDRTNNPPQLVITTGGGGAPFDSMDPGMQSALVSMMR
jgi:hypothetical protein